MNRDGRLCIKCGHLGHISRECNDDVLPAWEQSYLREVVFGSPAQTNFAEASFGAYDGNIHAYGTYALSGTSQSQITPPLSRSTMDSSPSPSSHSLHFGFAGLSVQKPEIVSVDVNPVDGSAKRPRLENEPEIEQPRQTQQPAPFQASDERPKRKGQKRVGKRFEPQPLVGLFNDAAGRYHSPISIRQVLQTTKVEMSRMDLVAWSPAVCRELKRLWNQLNPAFGYQPQQFPPLVPATQMPQNSIHHHSKASRRRNPQ